MKEFNSYHPIANFLYFVSVIGFSMIFTNPVCLAISFVNSLLYSIILMGKNAIKFNILYMFPLAVISALMNPVFNHQGITILTYLPDGNPLTLESIAYGLCAVVMLISVISWFSCFNKIITSDKLMYLFGRIIPALSLVFSMVLRFVPRFNSQIKTVLNSQRCVGRDVSTGSIIQKAKNGIKILSIMITWSLENAIDTADSMKSRGYGLRGRTAFSNYKFSKRDIIFLCLIIFLSIYVMVNFCMGKMNFMYYPYIHGAQITVHSALAFTAYFLLCSLPIIIEIKEAYKWKLLKSKI